jgi:hypothetical protein
VSCVDDPVDARAIWYVAPGRVRSCVRPALRGLMTAGPDAIRSLAPKQIYALEWHITLDGFLQAPVRPVRHHAAWDCCRPAIGFSTHEQSPYDPRHFVSLCHRDEPCGPAFELNGPSLAQRCRQGSSTASDFNRYVPRNMTRASTAFTP